MTLYGVDVHGIYQAGLNIPKLKQEGFTFCTVKCSEGLSSVGSSGDYGKVFYQWIPKIISAGLIPGAYHWIHTGKGKEQATYFYNRVKAAGGPTGFMIQLDCEDEDGVGYQTLKDFRDQWNSLSNNHPFLLYTGDWWWNSGSRASWDGNAITPYLWRSEYVVGNDYASVLYEQVPNSWWGPAFGKWQKSTILQYSSTGKAGGLTKVDVNAFEGSLNELKQLTQSVNVEDDMTLEEHNWLMQVYNAIFFGGPSMGAVAPVKINAASKGNAIIDLVQDLRTNTATINTKVSGDLVDEGAIASQVIAALNSSQIADAIIAGVGPEVANDVVGLLAQKLGATNA